MGIGNLFKKVFGSKNEREIKKLQPFVEQINSLEAAIQPLTDAQLKAKTGEFRQRLENGEELDDLLPEAFAVVREAGVRTLNMRHYDVQLIGGAVLHSGTIAEMKTGEGKTLVAALPIYANALLNRGVHLVTVNDYLATRDAEWMGKIYEFLGMSVGVIVADLSTGERRRAYNSDITYGTNNEFGFDYLRDNMKFSLAEYVQREHFFAIVDEVDSILVDEARTPLIISGRPEDSSALYMTINRVIPQLRSEIDYTVDEQFHSSVMTDEGIEKVEMLLGNAGILKDPNMFDPANLEILHHVNQALRAHTLYKRDDNYVVKDGKVIIVDEHTGRLMSGRRWSDGLHQAVEAKENVSIRAENRTLATITFQNFFRMYKKLAGMTGTAETEAEEFSKIYDLDVIVVPTNMPLIREDNQDLVYKTEDEKFTAVLEEIISRHQTGQPLLVGTVSVEKSERLSRVLKRKGIRHEVLNAKNHAREADIVAQAGRLTSLTISTNMAGRGTDIVLGGNAEYAARKECLANGWVIPDEAAHPYREGESTLPDGEEPREWVDKHGLRLRPGDPLPEKFEEALARLKPGHDAEREQVLACGGLGVIGTERHDSRRIDNQLRGRAGRQGDPGMSRFYVSLEDDLMRIFGAERVKRVMEWSGMQEGEPIEHKWVSSAIENAQKKVEGSHFDTRKNLLEYDDVMNSQRKTIYTLRREVLQGSYLDEEQAVDPDAERKLKRTRKWPIVPPPDPEPVLHSLDDRDREAERQEAKQKEVLKGFREIAVDLVDEVVEDVIPAFVPAGAHADDIDIDGLTNAIKDLLNVEVKLAPDELRTDRVTEKVAKAAREFYEKRELDVGPERLSGVARWLYLQEIDSQWMDHLTAMEHLREGIGLRGYGQRDPKQEYKREGFALFVDMLARVKENTVKKLTHVQFKDEVQADQFKPKARQISTNTSTGTGKPKTVKRALKVGRNDPCHCGSGKKYKKCHLPLEQAAST